MRVPTWLSVCIVPVFVFSIACTSSGGDDDGGDDDTGEQSPDDDDDDDDGPPDDDDDDQGSGPDAGTDNNAELCTEPGSLGNTQGVGEYCTDGGGECGDNDGATFCTIEHEADAPPFCTKPCFSANDCGPGATCTSQEGSPLMGCVPDCLAP